jgi:valyl-tRNA synthetase
LRERYAKELVRLESEVARLEKKLNNESYTSKASPEAVSKDREKLVGYEAELARTRAGLAALEETPEDR